MHTRRSRYLRHRFPPDIIGHAVWLYHRYGLSFRDVEDLLAEPGTIVSYETVRQWRSSARKLPDRRVRGAGLEGAVGIAVWVPLPQDDDTRRLSTAHRYARVDGERFGDVALPFRFQNVLQTLLGAP